MTEHERETLAPSRRAKPGATLSGQGVLFVINNMGGGGAERVVATLANHLRVLHGVRVQILMLQGGPVMYDLDPEVEVRSLVTGVIGVGVGRILGLPIFAAELAYFLRRHPTTVVMSFLVRSNLALVLTRWLGNRRAIVISERCATDVVYGDSSLGSWLMRRLVAGLYPYAHRVVAISQGVKESLVTLGVSAAGVRVIYNPQEIDAIQSSAPQRSRRPSRPRPFRIVTAGRLAEQKDYPTLLKAFQRVCARGVDARLVVLGDGPDHHRLKALALRLDIQDRVDWLGWIHSPYATMAACDLFVLASRWEGFGNVLVEAMACGLPIVSTDCRSGPREILADGEYGLLVSVGDDEALAAAIERLAGDPSARRLMRERGLHRARDFDVHRIAPQYMDVLAEAAVASARDGHEHSTGNGARVGRGRP